jgi:hypothetical protein
MPTKRVNFIACRHKGAIANGCIVTAFALVLAACSSKPGNTPSTSAQAQPPATSALTAAEKQRRSERIRTYFQERTRQRAVIATTRTGSGQIIDWIRPESQLPPGQKLSPAPQAARANKPSQYTTKVSTYVKAPGVERLAKTEIQAQPRARGPRGTVPVVRFDVDSYLKNERDLPERPEDVLKKAPPPSPDANNRYYGVWQRFDTFFGTSGRINIWDTAGPNSGETSIAQTAVIRGNPMQAIEAGKIESSPLNGDDLPHFFTYFRTNGQASGDWVGGYNTQVKGWIQVSSSVAPGMSLASWDSTVGGNQYSLDLEVRLWNGNWWIRAAGEWVGYYPLCNGGGGFSPCSGATLFSETGIRDKADRLDWYGEVFDSSAPTPTTTDMGSGRFASEAWAKSAYFRNLTFYWQSATYWWWDSGAPTATDSACYSVSGPFFSQADAWHNWFYYGGPGKDAQGCK